MQEKIIHKIKSILEKSNLPSISVYIEKDNQVILNEAFGYSNLEQKIKAHSKTQYNIGSMLKLMTASCIAILKDQNQLKFNSKLSELLPFDFCKNNELSNITIHQLLTHTSGLPLGFINENPSIEIEYQDSLLRILKDIKLIHKPNTTVSYSNYGYGILGLIVEFISKQKFEYFLVENLLQALEFDNLNPFLKTEKLHENIARPYIRKKGHCLELKPIRVKAVPAGEGYFTMGDYAKLIRMHTNKGKHNDRIIIQEKTVQEMHTITSPNIPEDMFGYGCIRLPKSEVDIDNEKYGEGIFHTGGVSGYSCSYTTNKKGNYFILFAINTLWEFEEMYELRDYSMKLLNEME